MYIFDVIGTIAFAIAGALVGVQKKLDIFGVIILALTTALGGGLVRDVIIGNIPPMALRNESFVLMSIISAVVVFVLHYHIIKFNLLILICDAIGLGAFAAAGAAVAVQYGQTGILPITALAVITAAGGGAIRDIFVQEIPGIFCKEIYAVAALAGAVCFYYLYPLFGENIALNTCFVVTCVLRLIAMRYNFNLPYPNQKI